MSIGTSFSNLFKTYVVKPVNTVIDHINPKKEKIVVQTDLKCNEEYIFLTLAEQKLSYDKFFDHPEGVSFGGTYTEKEKEKIFKLPFVKTIREPTSTNINTNNTYIAIHDNKN